MMKLNKLRISYDYSNVELWELFGKVPAVRMGKAGSNCGWKGRAD